MTMLKRISAIMLIGALGCLFASHALMAQTATAKTAPQATAAAKGPRPEQFKYPPLDFKPPKAAEFRADALERARRLHRRGPRDSLVRSHAAVAGHRRRRRTVGRGRGADGYDWPQRGGGGGGGSRSFLEPPDKLGVQALTGAIVRAGGTTSDDRRADQRADGLPGRHRDRHEPGPSTSRHVDEGLKIWMDLLNNPAFPEDRLQREKQGMLPAHPEPQPEHQHGRQPHVPAPDLRRRLADRGRADRGHDQRHHARRPRGVAQEVLGRQQRHPRRGGRLQEGRDAAEARGHLRQVAHGREGGTADGRRPSRRRRPASTWCSPRA